MPAAQWPQAWSALLLELRAGRDRPALLDCGAGMTDELIRMFADQGADVASFGQMLFAGRGRVKRLSCSLGDPEPLPSS